MHSKRQKQSVLRTLLAFALVTSPGLYGLDRDQGCLYSTVVDGKPTQPCDYQDALKVASNAEVLKVARAFSIDLATIAFRACRNGEFSTTQDPSKTDHYIITYPIEDKDAYLAPIVHEVAHVVQMQMVGGLEPLRAKLTSLRIELGADYLAGLAYSRVLTHINQTTFEHSLRLNGRYREPDAEKAHGTPAQRTAAFRYGLIDLNKANIDVRKASENFQANLYAEISRF